MRVYENTQINDNIIHKIKKLIEQKNNVIFYGIGARLLQILASTEAEKLNVLACVDGNTKRQGEKIKIADKTFCIKSITDIHCDSQTVFVICVNAKQYEAEIVTNIKKHGYSNIEIL